jgi:hypothetical protein
MYALMRRELARADAEDTIVSAHIMERIPLLFPDVSDLIAEPRCGPDLLQRMEGSDDVTMFSRRALSRVRSASALADTTDVMDRKARYLMRIIDLDDAAIRPYAPLPGELGPYPSKSELRFAALAALAGSNVMLNVPSARAFLESRLRAPRDDREAWILQYSARSEIESSLWGHPTFPKDDRAPALVRAWVEDLERRVSRPSDALALEIAIDRLDVIGNYAGRFGALRRANAVVGAIVAARGDVPLARGIPGGAHDLDAAARAAQFALAREHGHVEGRGIEPRRTRPPIHVTTRTYGIGRERAPLDMARARMRTLEEELAVLRFAGPRCYVLHEQAAWVPDDDVAGLFTEMTEPMFDVAGRIALSAEMLCRARMALNLDGAPETARIALAVRLLRAGAEDIVPFDLTGSEIGPAVVVTVGKGQVREPVAAAIADHPSWIDSPGLRKVLADMATSGDETPPADTIESQTALDAWEHLLPTFELLLEYDARGREVEKAEGRRILLSWIEALRNATRREQTGSRPLSLAIAIAYAVGEHAPRFGLAVEAEAVFGEIERGAYAEVFAPAVAVARYLGGS